MASVRRYISSASSNPTRLSIYASQDAVMMSQPLVALEPLLNLNAFFEDVFGLGQTLLSEIDQT